MMAEHPLIDPAPGRARGGTRRAAAAFLLLAAGLAAPANAAPGWQAPVTFDVPRGTKSMFFHLPCPASDPVVVSGGYAANEIGQNSPIHTGFNGPRLDETRPNFGDWGWHFFWPAGSPQGVRISFDVYCIAK
jgi:hypothetical protein